MGRFAKISQSRRRPLLGTGRLVSIVSYSRHFPDDFCVGIPIVGAFSVNSEYELACGPPFQALTGTLELEHFQIRAAPAPVTRQQHQHQHINCEH